MIIWGRRTKERPIGWVAEFCPICREIQAFKLLSLDRVFHVYFIPLSQKSIGEELTCAECGYGAAIAAKQYSYVLPQRASTEALVASTNPDIRTTIRERLALEERVKNGSLSHEQRIHAIAMPIALSQPYIENRARRSGSESALAVVTVFLVATLFVTLILIFSPPTPLWLKTVASLGSGGLLVLEIYLITTQNRRAATKFGLPLLARALAPLQPRRDEIDQAIAELRKAKTQVWRWFRSYDIERAVEAYRANDVNE